MLLKRRYGRGYATAMAHRDVDGMASAPTTLLLAVVEALTGGSVLITQMARAMGTKPMRHQHVEAARSKAHEASCSMGTTCP